MDIKKIEKAITLGMSYVCPNPVIGGMRCFDSHMGYGKYVDLTSQEYEIYQRLTNLTVDEKLKRLEELS